MTNGPELLPEVYSIDNKMKVLAYEIAQLPPNFKGEEVTEKIDYYQKAHKVISFNLAYEL